MATSSCAARRRFVEWFDLERNGDVLSRNFSALYGGSAGSYTDFEKALAVYLASSALTKTIGASRSARGCYRGRRSPLYRMVSFLLWLMGTALRGLTDAFGQLADPGLRR